jgi:type III pantothenate kinase
MSWLAIDVGNTRMKWALVQGTGAAAHWLAHGHCELEEIGTLARTHWRRLIAPERIVASNVAGETFRRRVEDECARWHVPVEWITAQAAQCGLTNNYDKPTLLGSDRWAALVAAHKRLPSQACVVITVGTAVTVDAISADGHFLGGLIVPGFGLMLDALESGTAGLRVPPGEYQDFPTNTSNALMSGGIHALAGAAERIVAQMTASARSAPQVLMAGGAAIKLEPFLSFPFTHVDNLVLEGLAWIYEELPPPAPLTDPS